jgi:hypothetical protein
MFDAVLFLGGAVLFLLAVVFFVVLWQQRVEVEVRETTIQQMEAKIREQRVDLEILEHELSVWEDGLAQEQRMLEEAREELRMLTAAKHGGEETVRSRSSVAPDLQPTEKPKDERSESQRYLIKNVKPAENQKID